MALNLTFFGKSDIAQPFFYTIRVQKFKNISNKFKIIFYSKLVLIFHLSSIYWNGHIMNLLELWISHSQWFHPRRSRRPSQTQINTFLGVPTHERSRLATAKRCAKCFQGIKHKWNINIQDFVWSIFETHRCIYLNQKLKCHFNICLCTYICMFLW